MNLPDFDFVKYWVIGLKILIAGVVSAVTYGAVVGAIISYFPSHVRLLTAISVLIGLAVLGFIVNKLYKWE